MHPVHRRILFVSAGNAAEHRGVGVFPRIVLLLAALSTGCFPRVGEPHDGGPADAGDGGNVGPTCSDRVRSGDETAVDCGGSCAPCAQGLGCRTALDCVSGLCSGDTCAAPTGSCAGFGACSSFLDLTAAGAERTITFGGERYSPSCVRVRFGQSVTWTGNFGSHPLREACGPVAAGVSASSGQTTTVTFDRALGVFGFYCDVHGSSSGAGMAGAIEVVR